VPFGWDLKDTLITDLRGQNKALAEIRGENSECLNGSENEAISKRQGACADRISTSARWRFIHRRPLLAENLSKAEIVDVVAKAADITKAAAAKAINCALDTIAAHVNKGGKVALVGFGTFSQKSRKARTGRNPQTGEPIKIAASKSMSFKASKAAKAAKAAKPKAKAAKPAKKK